MFYQADNSFVPSWSSGLKKELYLVLDDKWSTEF